MFLADTKHVSIERREHGKRSYYAVFFCDDHGDIIGFSKYHDKRNAFLSARMYVQYGLKNIRLMNK